jgi:type I restriction enzyme, S subunit
MTREILLSNVIDEISMGPFGSNIKIDNFVPSGIPVLNGANLNGRKLVEKTFNFISEEKANDLGKANAKKGDVVITHRGTLGQVSYIPYNSKYDRYIISQSQFRVRFKKEMNPIYITYLFHTEYGQKKLLSFKSHVGVPALAQATSNFKCLRLDVHDRIYQDKIADVLTAFDNKIELNNKINAELEAMAKTIYNYWFTQFDFPDEAGNPYKSSGGKMIWNEKLKRKIPEGWKVIKMSEWINIDKSGDWGKDNQEGNFTKKVICIRGADINGLNGLTELKAPVRYILEKNSIKILESHDLIVEISGGSPVQSTGRLAFITNATMKRLQYPLICSNFCKPISIKSKKFLYNFVYYWNSLYENGIFFDYEGKTSGIKNLLFDSFINSYYTVMPDEKSATQFYSLMEYMQDKKQAALAENHKLAELRDWLSPMLMNGQVTVS